MSTIMSISLVLFIASLLSIPFEKNMAIITNISAIVYSVCFGIRYYSDGFLLAVLVMGIGAAYIGLALLLEWIDGDGRDCIVILPGQTITGGQDES